MINEHSLAGSSLFLENLSCDAADRRFFFPMRARLFELKQTPVFQCGWFQFLHNLSNLSIPHEEHTVRSPGRDSRSVCGRGHAVYIVTMRTKFLCNSATYPGSRWSLARHPSAERTSGLPAIEGHEVICLPAA